MGRARLLAVLGEPSICQPHKQARGGTSRGFPGYQWLLCQVYMLVPLELNELGKHRADLPRE